MIINFTFTMRSVIKVYGSNDILAYPMILWHTKYYESLNEQNLFYFSLKQNIFENTWTEELQYILVNFFLLILIPSKKTWVEKNLNHLTFSKIFILFHLFVYNLFYICSIYLFHLILEISSSFQYLQIEQ